MRAIPTGELRVTALDVGQGDSLLVDLPDGRLLLIDGGGFVGSPVDPGERVLIPELRARRRRRVDIVVLSHPHPDHFTGLVSALRSVEVGELWDTGQGRREGAGATYATLIQNLRDRNIPIRGPRDLCGRPLRFGAAKASVLAPCPDFVPGRGANDNSFVIRIELAQRAVLLTGDAERQEEEELLDRRSTSLRADLLKVGHHGSRTSTSPALLARVNPAIAMISCGVRNRFGHPHPETLETLARHGVTPLRTDTSGAISWTTDGHAMFVEVAR